MPKGCNLFVFFSYSLYYIICTFVAQEIHEDQRYKSILPISSLRHAYHLPGTRCRPPLCHPLRCRCSLGAESHRPGTECGEGSGTSFRNSRDIKRGAWGAVKIESDTTNAHCQSRPLIWEIKKVVLVGHAYSLSSHHYLGGPRTPPLQWRGHLRRLLTVVESMMVDGNSYPHPIKTPSLIIQHGGLDWGWVVVVAWFSNTCMYMYT